MLKVNPKFENLFAPLSTEEYAGLEQDIIATNGPREPIVVWNDTIVDGHHRYEICQKHDLPFATREETFSSEAEAIAWMIKEQFNRRNMSTVARTIAALNAKEALIEIGRQTKSLRKDLADYVAESHNTRKLIAEKAGVSDTFVYQVDYVLQHGEDKLQQAMISEEMSVGQAYSIARKADERLERKKQRREEAAAARQSGKTKQREQPKTLPIPAMESEHEICSKQADSQESSSSFAEAEDTKCLAPTDPQEASPEFVKASPAFAKAVPEEQEHICELAVKLHRTPEDTARFLKVDRDADEETKEKLLKGDMSINEAYLLLTRPPEVTNLNAFDNLLPFEDNPDSFPLVIDLVHRAVDGFNVLLRTALGQYSVRMITPENRAELEQVIRSATSIPTKVLAERMATIDPQVNDGYSACKQLISDYEANADETFTKLEKLYTDEVATHDLDAPIAETLCRVENKSKKLRIIMNRPLMRAKAKAQEAPVSAPTPLA